MYRKKQQRDQNKHVNSGFESATEELTHVNNYGQNIRDLKLL